MNLAAFPYRKLQWQKDIKCIRVWWRWNDFDFDNSESVNDAESCRILHLLLDNRVAIYWFKDRHFWFSVLLSKQRILANNFIKLGILQKKILLRVTTRVKISDQLRYNNSWRTRFIKFALYSEAGEKNVFTLFILWVLFLFSNTVPFVVHDCSLMSFISMPFCELKKNFRWIFCFSQVSFGGYCWKVMSRFGFEFHQRFHQ